MRTRIIASSPWVIGDIEDKIGTGTSSGSVSGDKSRPRAPVASADPEGVSEVDDDEDDDEEDDDEEDEEDEEEEDEEDEDEEDEEEPAAEVCPGRDGAETRGATAVPSSIAPAMLSS